MMFSERHRVSLLKRGTFNGKSKLKIQGSLEKLSEADKDYNKIDVQGVPSDIRKETILWMMTEAHNLRAPRRCLYKAVDGYDLMCSGGSSDDLEQHKLDAFTALLIENMINREKEIICQTADSYLDDLVLLLEDSAASNEQNKAVLEMREVLDLCILEKCYRMYSPLALAGGVYFWYARGAQAPWLHFLSSMCPDIAKVVDWVAPLVKMVNGHPLGAQSGDS